MAAVAKAGFDTERDKVVQVFELSYYIDERVGFFGKRTCFGSTLIIPVSL